MENILPAISNVGFPIVAFLMACYYIYKCLEGFRASIDKNTEALLKMESAIRAILDDGRNNEQ